MTTKTKTSSVNGGGFGGEQQGRQGERTEHRHHSRPLPLQQAADLTPVTSSSSRRRKFEHALWMDFCFGAENKFIFYVGINGLR
jgi:hypothetical protein